MTDPAFFGYDKTRLEIRVLDAAMEWYRGNRYNYDVLASSELFMYYHRPEVRALVEACADLEQATS